MKPHLPGMNGAFEPGHRALRSGVAAPQPPQAADPSLFSALTGESASAGQQAFAKWLSQYQPPTPAAATPSPPHAPATAAQGEALTPARSVAPHAAASPAQYAKAPTRPWSAAHAQPQPPQTPQRPLTPSRPAAPAGQRTGSTPTPSAQEGPPSEAAGGVEASPAPQEFATDRGVATAWVQELQPPPGVSITDPAAIMAWLASLNRIEPPPAEVPVARVQADDAGAGGPLSATDPRGGPGASQQATEGAPLPSASQGAVTARLDRELASDRPTAGAGLGVPALLGGSWQAAPLTEKTSTPEARHFTGGLSTPTDSPEFAQALADRVSLWVSGPGTLGPMTAELRLNPQEMGPVHIRIELDGQSAQVDFAAAQASTRDAIESSLPLLTRALEEAGLSLAGSGVSDQGGRQAWQGSSQPGSDRQTASGGGHRADDGAPAGLSLTRMAARSGSGLAGGLDLYA